MAELLSPVADFVMLEAAISSGCDAVYFGVKGLNMRASAKNFEISELGKVVARCSEAKVKTYLTLNTIVYDDEIEKFRKILKAALDAGVSAVICWDMAVLSEGLKIGMEMHLSTQASIANSAAANFYGSLGVKRIVLARECSLEQLKSIVKNSDVEVEVFAHGARCISMSGRCFISQQLFGKSANRGECLQPCRRQYVLKDVETGDSLSVDNQFVLSPKDLCTLPFLDKLVATGVVALKLEGRNRSPEYVKVVTSCYRRALDAIAAGSFTEELKNELVDELKTVYNRDLSPGFYLGIPTSDDHADAYGSKATSSKQYVGFVKNYFKKVGAAEVKLESLGLSVGDKVMVQGPTTGVQEQVVRSMQIDNKDVRSCSKGDRVAVKLDFVVRPNDKVFLIK